MALFRPARPAPPRWNLLKTAVQTVVIWTLALAVVPIGITTLEHQVGIPSFAFAGQGFAGWGLFAVASLLGLASGATMAWRGAGTPLPTDCPRHLVIQGPYRHVRNPMAVAGLAQGAGVGLALGSWSVLLYVLAGGATWNLFVRPAEERDLAARFGDDFEQYRRRIRCWWPRWPGYRPDGPRSDDHDDAN